MAIAARLRTDKQLITDRWEARILEVTPALGRLTRSELVDHMPEFLEGLADWIDGKVAEAREGFKALARGHALQRHGAGIELEELTSEYVTLRVVVLERIVETNTPEEVARSIVALEAGIDCAVNGAVHHYANERDRVRERFIGILAHDLRDPLSAVMMSASLLAEMVSGERATQLVERIARGAARIEGMIDDVLDFARGRLVGGIPVSPQLADMGQICAAAVDEALAGRSSSPVELATEGDLRGHFDPARVRQALANLLANARHHGKGAPITVRAWEADDRRHLFTSVTNFGPPIPKHLLERLFDPFVREDTRGRGLGLGLYIVQQVALAHGGRVLATSSEEAGTTFTIEWPRVPLEETPGRPTS